MRKTSICVALAMVCLCGCTSRKFSGFITGTKALHARSPDGRIRNTPIGFTFWDWDLAGLKQDWESVVGSLRDDDTCEVVLICPRTSVEFYEQNCAVLRLSKDAEFPPIRTSDIAIESGNALRFGLSPGPVTITHRGWHGHGWIWPGRKGMTIDQLSFEARAKELLFIRVDLARDQSRMVLVDDKDGVELLRRVQKEGLPAPAMGL